MIWLRLLNTSISNSKCYNFYKHKKSNLAELVIYHKPTLDYNVQLQKEALNY